MNAGNGQEQGHRVDRVDRVAVITGASKGLGLALARRLAADGWRLVVDARRADQLAVAGRELAGSTEVTALNGDVTDTAHREELAAAARRLGPVRLLVNNASTLGASPQPAIADLDAELLRRILDVNVVAPLALTRLLLADLGDGGVVVNITSDAAVEAYPGWGGYGASKAALAHASSVLAAERPDIRVLVVDPGDMRTEMHQDAFPGEDISDRSPPESSADRIAELITGDHPSGRYGAASDTWEVQQ